jgi:hypothetical protein
VLNRGVGHVSDTELLHKLKAEPMRRLEVFTGPAAYSGDGDQPFQMMVITNST